MFYYIGTKGGKVYIYGEGNTKQMAVAAGEWNANHDGATNTKVVGYISKLWLKTY